MQIELIIFDCDGLVVDSELLANTLAAKLKTQFGFPITAEEHIRKFVGLSNKSPEYLEIFSKLPSNYKEVALKERELLFKDKLNAVENIEYALKNLDINYCLASSGSMDKMDLTLGLTGLKHYFFNKIFSADMVDNGKPSPDVFLYAAKEMKTNPKNCLVIEDSVPGIIAAKAAGMKVLGFDGGSHMLPFMKERIIAQKPDLIFSNMSKLPDIIKQFIA